MAEEKKKEREEEQKQERAEKKERKEDEKARAKASSSHYYHPSPKRQALFSFEKSGLQCSARNEVRSPFCVQSDNEMATDVCLKFSGKIRKIAGSTLTLTNESTI